MLRHWAPGRSLTIELAAGGARKPTLFLPTGSAVRKIGESGRDEPFNEAKRAMVSRGTTGTNLAVDTFSRRGHPIGSRQPMNHLRYVVVAARRRMEYRAGRTSLCGRLPQQTTGPVRGHNVCREGRSVRASRGGAGRPRGRAFLDRMDLRAGVRSRRGGGTGAHPQPAMSSARGRALGPPDRIRSDQIRSMAGAPAPARNIGPRFPERAGSSASASRSSA
jgi:hypothetical protein